ncbi:hypothetical protein ABL78_1609 [Leptomonas seymouri]|uniref:Pre-mRNA-splicing factor of RES complex n=1 Tax=Leptomonas seymouri TaxID=5684 RepID=A0A0N0P7X4_LEPSE|nr:hypothetical protein ABL78_1609 [Leptomonas seymouri]|eukprot:KPI89276.1 hypothetical protein ABL78_1609 [Leptomonas seymouri]
MSQVPAKRRRLDSDDDDDDYAQPRRNSPLLHYAITTALPTDEVPLLGYAGHEVSDDDREPPPRGSSGAPKRVLSDAGGVPAAGDGDAAVAVLTKGETTVAVSSGFSAVFDEDEDIPAEYKGLFSTELMNVLLVPFDYICKQKALTDKLLAQYLPPQATAEGTESKSDAKVYRNAYGITPGFRWDGVVRGRGPVE